MQTHLGSLLLLLALTACGRLSLPASSTPANLGGAAATPVGIAQPLPTETFAPTATPDAPTPVAPAPDRTTAVATHTNAGGVAIDRELSTLAARDAFSGAVLVARAGVVLLSQGYNLADRGANLPNTAATTFRIGSLTKQFTAMAILLLQARGQLNVQDPVCAYLEACPAAWQPITLHHLLTHTAGLPDLTRFPDFEATKATPSPPPATIARIAERPLQFTPGSRWQYSNSGYIVLGYVIERVSGQAYADFLQANLFAPLQMTRSGYDRNHDTSAQGYTGEWRMADFVDMSIPYAAGALYSTVEDLYRWSQALDTYALLPSDAQAAMFAPLPTGMLGPDAGYGYGWVIGAQDGRRVVAHGGAIEGFSARIERYPDERVTIIVLTNNQSINPRAIIEAAVAPHIWDEST